MIVIELLKIFKRKFNYTYLLIATLFLISIPFIKNTYFSNIELTREEFLYDYSMKLILVSTILFGIVNLLLSYSIDYNDQIAKLIKFSNISRFYNLFAKMIVNYSISTLFYFILLSIYILIFYRDSNIMLSKIMANNVIISLLLILLVINLALLIVVIFTSVYLALPLTILMLTSLTFIREFINEEFKVQLAGDIFSYSFSTLSVQQISIDMLNLIQILIYTVCIFFISIIVKLIKNN